MKKTVLMTLFTLVVMGCKEKSTEATASIDEVNKVTVENKCETSFEEFENIPEEDILARVEWLDKKSGNICKSSLFKYSFHSHKLLEGEYQTGVARYGRSQTPLIMTWKEIRNIIKDTTRANYYKNYITFNQLENDKLEMTLTKKFTRDSTCYSIPLFLSIADSLKINDDDEKTIFLFSKSVSKNEKKKT